MITHMIAQAPIRDRAPIRAQSAGRALRFGIAGLAFAIDFTRRVCSMPAHAAHEVLAGEEGTLG